MLGWMLIFTLMLFTAAVASMAGGISVGLGLASCTIFGMLLLLLAFTRILRGQA